MTIAESLYFKYDGIDSRDMGLLNVNLSTGLQEEFFLPEREIQTVSIRGRSKPYMQDIVYKPLQIPLKFAFANQWEESQIRATIRWLSQDYYKPLLFSSNPNRIFYAMYKDSPKLLHNCLSQGYIDIVMENIDAYTYSPVYEQIFDLSSNPTEGTNIIVSNLGSVDCYPMFEIQIMSGSSFSITNNSSGGALFSMTGLQVNELLKIDCETEDIVTDIPLTYRYDNVAYGSKFTKLVYGNNTLNVKGNIKLKVRTQYKILH